MKCLIKPSRRSALRGAGRIGDGEKLFVLNIEEAIRIGIGGSGVDAILIKPALRRDVGRAADKRKSESRKRPQKRLSL